MQLPAGGCGLLGCVAASNYFVEAIIWRVRRRGGVGKIDSHAPVDGLAPLLLQAVKFKLLHM